MSDNQANHYYHLPKTLLTSSGAPRRVGFELEFAGLEMKQAASILAKTLNGTVKPDTEAECKVDTEAFGPFTVELDWHFGKTTARERAQELGQSQSDQTPDGGKPDDPLMEWVTRVASQVVPVEIVCPPIAIEKIGALDDTVEALREAGALGTEESLIYAFGVHINPEVVDETAASLTRYLKAYCVAQDWLVSAHGVDLARRITPYINLYPNNYVKQVCQYDAPDTATLIDDYLDANPTRNRALDLTPLIKHLDEERLKTRLDDPRINARPTFHYRMPNCEIEKPGWHLNRCWNIWGVIEYLAEQESLLADLTAQCFDHHNKLIKLEKAAWHPLLDELHNDLS